MGRFTRARAAIALVAALAVGWSAGLASASEAGLSDSMRTGDARPGPGAVRSAVAFREKLGFRADRGFVASTFDNPAFDDAAWGVPLDRAEAADVARRAAVQGSAAKAAKAWAGHAESGGAYIDLRGGGIPVFLTTGDPGRARRALAATLPAGAAGSDARFVRVDYTTDALLALQARIDADLVAGVLEPYGVGSTAIDTRGNAVVVGVASEGEEVLTDLTARYGDAIRVVVEAPAQGGDAGCLSRKDCPPAKGGVEIVSSYTGNSCTAGFMVRVVGSPSVRILTAGHCIGLSGGTGSSRTWSSGGENLGWSEFSTWTDGADADAGLLAPATGAVAGDRNLLFRASKDDVIPIAGWQPNVAQLQGGLICRGGAVSGYRCGTITLTNRTKAVEGRTMDHQWVVDFDGCPGDSGGPYVLGNVAYGIHSDSTLGCNPSTNEAWYSPIGWVLTTLAAKGHPVELCTTSTCGSETNSWTQRGSLDGSVWSPRLVPLSDGRVLSVGGLRRDPLAADTEASGASSPQLYDPATGIWSDAPAPPWAPADCEGQFAVRLANARVLVGGGREANGASGACAGAFLFDPTAGAEDAWSSAAAPPVDLVSAGAVLLADGRAFVTGGSGADGRTSVALAYSPDTDEWTTRAAAPAGSLAPLVLPLIDGRVLVSGGRAIADVDAGGFEHVPGTYLYDPGANTWATTTAVGRDGAAGIVLGDGRVIVAGGQHLTWDGAQGSTLLTNVNVLHPGTSTWTTLAPLRVPRANITLAELPNGMLLAAAGRVAGPTPAGVPSNTADAYDWATKAWYAAPALRASRAEQGTAVLDDGSILVAGGGASSSETYLAGDMLGPTASTPTIALRSGVTLGSGAPVRIAFSGTDTGGSGTATFDVARSSNGGAWTTIATKVTAATLDTTVGVGQTHRFQVRARDWAGNVGPWKAGATVKVGLTQQTAASIAYAGSWWTHSMGAYSGGTARFAKAGGATATYSFTGRGVAFVTTKGSRGSARIYVDGVLATTVNLYASTGTYRFVAFQRTWSTSGNHRIAVVVSGTSGHPRVDVDAFVVLSNP